MTPSPESPSRGQGNPRAAAVIWDWRGAEGAARERTRRARTRWTGALQGLVSAAIGLVLFLLWSPGLAYVAWGIGALTAGSAFLSPEGLYRRIQTVFRVSGAALGRVSTWVLLLPVFYAFFLPFGALFRRGSKDRLERRALHETASYWKPREAKGVAPSDYEKQF